MATLCPSFIFQRGPPSPPFLMVRSPHLSITRAFTNIHGSKPRHCKTPFLLSTPPSLLATAAATASSFNLSPPPIDHDDESIMAAGEKALEGGGLEVSRNDEQAIEAALNGVALLETIEFSFFTTKPQQSLILSLMERDVMQLSLPQLLEQLILLMLGLWYIFYDDKVEVHDITEKTSFFVLVGPQSTQVMETLKLDHLIGQPYGTHRHYNVNGRPVTVGVGSVISKDGFSFLLSPSSAESVWKTLSSLGATPMGHTAWERLRVIQGRPAPGKELTKDFNVLEAGLRTAVSLDKGCYKGQETISRLITYNGVKQRLWGFNLSGPAEPGASIMVDGKKVGVLTSYSLGKKDGDHIGLGYVKRQVSPGEKVSIGDVIGTVIHVPFLCHSLQ